MTGRAPVYDCVFSLGQWCATALCLEKLGLRSCSGPFDWLLGSNNSVMRYVDFIVTGFEGFLLKENLRLVGEDRAAGHAHYSDEKSGFVFRHDFDLGEPLETAFRRVRVKYDRRIARMAAVLSGGKRILFVHYRGEGHDDGATLVAAVGRLRERFPSQIDLLSLETEKGCLVPRVESLGTGVTRVVGDFYDQSRFDPVMGDEKLVCEVLGAVRLRGRWRNLLRYRIKSFKRRLARKYRRGGVR